MKILFAASASGDAIAAPVYADRKLSDAAKALDSATSGAVTRAIEASRFKGGAGDLLEISGPDGVWFLPFTKDAVPHMDLKAGKLVANPPEVIEGDEDKDQ